MENGIINRKVYFWGRVALIALAVVLALGLCAARADFAPNSRARNAISTLRSCEEQCNVTSTGTCGDNLIWTLYEDGTLVISGTGAMRDYYENCGPWGNSVKNVIIEDGVTSIGYQAFYGCSSLTSITIPDSVTNIGSSAFMNCSSLTSITIPEGVTSIGEGTLYGCSSLTSITIPDSVTSIGMYAFYRCSGLTSITIPDSVTNIGYETFSGCGSLTSITIPDGVTSIGGSAFYDCSAIRYANMGSDAAKALGKAGYSFRVPGEKYDLLYIMNNDAVKGCEIRNVDKDATEIVIPDSVTSIGGSAFYNCSSLTSITIPEGVTNIGGGAFSGCSSLTSITIPKGVTSIGGDAFENCSSLTSITIPEGVTSIGNYAFSYCSSLTGIMIPEGVTSIGNRAFRNCSTLESITIPEGVTSIGWEAFSGCNNLTSVYIPESVTTFGDDPWGDDILGWSFSGTIYCHEFSEADYWATERGYNVVYVDGIDIESIRTLTIPGDFRMACGETRQLVADVFPNYDHPVVTWTSSSPEIVSVDDGLVTAIATGTAVITATLGDKSASVTVETYAPFEDFEMPSEIWVAAKSTYRAVPESITPAGSEGNFTWAMADTTLATVDETGLISGRKPGDTTLTVTETSTGIVRTTTVHVCYPVDAIEFDPDAVSMALGQKVQLTANVTARTQTFVNKLVTFSSSDETVATVDRDGVVTARGFGTATITAAAEDVSATCEVTVREASVLTLPVDLTAIEAEAFMGDLSLERVVIPDGCASIGSRAFAGCANLMYVCVPAGAAIADDAFEGCDQITLDIVE